MPARVPEVTKEGVIQSWLEGSTFREIANKNGISEGTVNNIIAEKKRQHGSDQLNFYRDLGVAMNKSELGVQQCADGHRCAMIFRNLGVDQTAIEGFIARLWKHWASRAIDPEKLAQQIDELHYFFERNEGVDIHASVSKVFERIRMAQEDLRRLQIETHAVESKKRESEEELCRIRSEMSDLEFELGLTKDIKQKLKADGFETNEFVHCIDWAHIVKGSGYSVHEITERLGAMAVLEGSVVKLRAQQTYEQARYQQLIHENTDLKEINSRYSLRLRELVSLDQMGFGFSQFKRLYNTLNEIAEAKGLSTDENAAVTWFFKYLEDYFYDFVDMEKTVQDRRAEISSLNMQRDIQLVALNLTPEVGKAIGSLLNAGIKKDVIKQVLKVIEQNRLCIPKKSPESNNGSSPSDSSKLASSGSNSEQDREISGSPSSVREDTETSWATIVFKAEDGARPNFGPNAFPDLSQDKKLPYEDEREDSVSRNTIKQGDLKSADRNGRRVEARHSRPQFALNAILNSVEDVRRKADIARRKRRKSLAMPLRTKQ